MAQTLVLGLLAAVVLVLGASPVVAQKPAGPIDTADAEWSGIQTELTEVRRMSDNTIRIRWRWRNTADKTHQISWAESDKVLKEDTYLLDPVNKKKHFVVTDAEGRPIGTDFPQPFNIKAKEAFSAWAKFPAPPPDVQKITIVIAKTPPFEDIAIAK